MCDDVRVAAIHREVPEWLVGFDTETTGLNVRRDQAISYGLCLYHRGELTWSDHYFVRPERPISEGARRVHGLTREDIEALSVGSRVLSVESGLRRVLKQLDDCRRRGAYVVGANVRAFDVAMLSHSAQRHLTREFTTILDDVDRWDFVDVVAHEREIEKVTHCTGRRSLSELCRRYDVVSGGHEALGDARAAVEVFLAQVRAVRSLE